MKRTTDQSVVILGGGFLGLFTALHLSDQQYPGSVTLIDRCDRFEFKPLLYEWLSSELSEEQVCPRYEALLQGSDITFRQETAQAIDLKTNRVQFQSGAAQSYDHLVLALGSSPGYAGVEGAKEYALPFRTRAHALKLRLHLRGCLQQALSCQDTAQRKQLLTVAIAGGGPSGVELAATLADLLPRWYAGWGGAADEIQVLLLNRSQQILSGDLNDPLREVAKAALQERAVPVEVRSEASVSAVYGDRLEYQQYDQTQVLPAATVVWTAGTELHPLVKALPIPDSQRGKHGRLLVSPTLQLPDFPNVWAGGDCATLLENELPPTAQVAYQQGQAIAENLKAIATGSPLQAADVSMRGSLLKLGMGAAGANLFEHVSLSGKSADLIRRSTYLTLLPVPAHRFKATASWLADEIFNDVVR